MARTNTRNMHKQRTQFKAECKEADADCWLCNLPIDYEADWNDFGNDNRFQLDHFYPVSTHPELQEDPTHFRPSHAGCNNERSNGAPRADLGILSREWA